MGGRNDFEQLLLDSLCFGPRGVQGLVAIRFVVLIARFCPEFLSEHVFMLITILLVSIEVKDGKLTNGQINKGLNNFGGLEK